MSPLPAKLLITRRRNGLWHTCTVTVQEHCSKHFTHAGVTYSAPAMQKHMSEKEAAEISLCLADFLAFCHSKGVVHRWAAAATHNTGPHKWQGRTAALSLLHDPRSCGTGEEEDTASVW